MSQCSAPPNKYLAYSIVRGFIIALSGLSGGGSFSFPSATQTCGDNSGPRSGPICHLQLQSDPHRGWRGVGGWGELRFDARAPRHHKVVEHHLAVYDESAPPWQPRGLHAGRPGVLMKARLAMESSTGAKTAAFSRVNLDLHCQRASEHQVRGVCVRATPASCSCCAG